VFRFDKYDLSKDLGAANGSLTNGRHDLHMTCSFLHCKNIYGFNYFTSDRKEE
jgi:hypothetical protein